MRRSAAVLLWLVFISLLNLDQARAQRAVTQLQPGTPIEREIGRGQVQRFTVSMEQDQFLQLVVEQRGIDLVVRVVSPDGQSLREFDSPNGNEGPENVSLISSAAGVYYIEVLPLGQVEDLAPGRYEIRIVEQRAASEQELQASKNQDVLKARAIALMTTLAESLPELHLPQTRVRAQIQIAELLWAADEKLAGKLVNDAIAGVRECLANVDSTDQDYYQNYGYAMQLRQEVLQVLATHDPEMALNFLRSTRAQLSPEPGPGDNQAEQERRYELDLARQIAAKDPKRALKIAEDILKTGYSGSLTETVNELRNSEPELAAKLAKEIAAKLQGERLVSNQEATNLALGLLRIAHNPPITHQSRSGNTGPEKVELLSEQEYRDLFAKTLAEGLKFSPGTSNFYSPEVNSARNIVNALKSMSTEMETFAPGSMAAAEKKVVELNTSPDPQNRLWQKYYDTINNGSVEAALEAVGKAPREMRDSLYQQVAGKVANGGDIARARQILTDGLANPMQRQQALNNLEQQAINNAISRGKIEEALRSIGNLRPARLRAIMISQIAGQIGPGQKRAAALNLLEQARSLLGVSPQAEDQEEMNALLQLAVAFSRYEPRRAFEVVEPLIDQFNEMSTAAVALNGFGQQYFQEGELLQQNGNSLATTANQLNTTLGRLGVANFDRAKADADRLQRAEARVNALIAIAQQATNTQGEMRPVNYRRSFR